MMITGVEKLVANYLDACENVDACSTLFFGMVDRFLREKEQFPAIQQALASLEDAYSSACRACTNHVALWMDNNAKLKRPSPHRKYDEVLWPIIYCSEQFDANFEDWTREHVEEFYETHRSLALMVDDIDSPSYESSRLIILALRNGIDVSVKTSSDDETNKLRRVVETLNADPNLKVEEVANKEFDISEKAFRIQAAAVGATINPRKRGPKSKN